MQTEVKPLIDWDHVYLLGWYDKTGRSYLTTWEGDRPYISVIITASAPLIALLHYWGPPIWDASTNHKPADWLPPPLHYADLELHSVGPGEDAKEKATRLGGIVAFGWYIQEGFRRGLHIEGCRKVHGLDDIPCWGGH